MTLCARRCRRPRKYPVVRTYCVTYNALCIMHRWLYQRRTLAVTHRLSASGAAASSTARCQLPDESTARHYFMFTCLAHPSHLMPHPHRTCRRRPLPVEQIRPAPRARSRRARSQPRRGSASRSTGQPSSAFGRSTRSRSCEPPSTILTPPPHHHHHCRPFLGRASNSGRRGTTPPRPSRP